MIHFVIPKTGARLLNDSGQSLFSFDSSFDKVIYKSSISQHPTESITVSDNRRILPMELTISGVIAESSMSQKSIEDARNGIFDADRVETKFDNLLSAWSSDHTLTVAAGNRIFENMAIVEMSIDRTKPTSSRLIDISLQEVIKVGLEFVEVPQNILARKRKKRNHGDQGDDKADEKEKEKAKKLNEKIKRKSIAASLADGEGLKKVTQIFKGGLGEISL